MIYQLIKKEIIMKNSNANQIENSKRINQKELSKKLNSLNEESLKKFAKGKGKESIYLIPKDENAKKFRSKLRRKFDRLISDILPYAKKNELSEIKRIFNAWKKDNSKFYRSKEIELSSFRSSFKDEEERKIYSSIFDFIKLSMQK